MCSNAVTSDLSVIYSSELSVICSSKKVVASYYFPSLQPCRPCCIVPACAGKASPSGRHASRRHSPPKNKFRLMSLFRTRPVAQSATVRFGTHHSRRLSCALSGGISTEPDFRLGSVQGAMGHEQCLYRSNAARQG